MHIDINACILHILKSLLCGQILDFEYVITLVCVRPCREIGRQANTSVRENGELTLNIRLLKPDLYHLNLWLNGYLLNHHWTIQVRFILI